MSIVVALASTVSAWGGLAAVSARAGLAASEHSDATRANGARHPLLTFGVIDHLADADGHRLPSHALGRIGSRASLGTGFGAVAARRMFVTERELIG
jgi:hypothetical protein